MHGIPEERKVRDAVAVKDGAEGRVIKIGAESVVSRTEFLGIAAVAKDRRPKGYRHPALERRLRTERLVREARTIPQARRWRKLPCAVVNLDPRIQTTEAPRSQRKTLSQSSQMSPESSLIRMRLDRELRGA